MLLSKVSVLKNTTRGFQLHGLKINYTIWGTQPKKETYEDILKNEIDFFQWFLILMNSVTDPLK